MPGEFGSVLDVITSGNFVHGAAVDFSLRVGQVLCVDRGAGTFRSAVSTHQGPSPSSETGRVAAYHLAPKIAAGVDLAAL